MARPLRIDVEGGWYHVMSRRIERRPIFLDDSYCLHFLELRGEITARFGVEVHAYVLMGNHYHLILRTPGANASQAMQSLNVSYSRYVQSHVTRGIDPAEFAVFSERVAIGSREFLDRARSWVQFVSPEQTDRAFLQRRVPFARIVSVVEEVKGERFAQFRDRHGDRGLAIVLYLARRSSGLTLAQIGDLTGGMAYKTVFEQVKRMGIRLQKDAALRAIADQCETNIRTPYLDNWICGVAIV